MLHSLHDMLEVPANVRVKHQFGNVQLEHRILLLGVLIVARAAVSVFCSKEKLNPCKFRLRVVGMHPRVWISPVVRVVDAAVHPEPRLRGSSEGPLPLVGNELRTRLDMLLHDLRYGLTPARPSLRRVGLPRHQRQGDALVPENVRFFLPAFASTLHASPQPATKNP